MYVMLYYLTDNNAVRLQRKSNKQQHNNRSRANYTTKEMVQINILIIQAESLQRPVGATVAATIAAIVAATVARTDHVAELIAAFIKASIVV